MGIRGAVPDHWVRRADLGAVSPRDHPFNKVASSGPSGEETGARHAWRSPDAGLPPRPARNIEKGINIDNNSLRLARWVVTRKVRRTCKSGRWQGKEAKGASPRAHYDFRTR
jgi:hypothetical protein